jgi:serine/threonine protein kinase/WD40 repeat protein
MTAAVQNHPPKEQLVAFGLGTLEPDEATQIEQHLESCSDCCETILDLADDTFVGLVRQCAVAAPASDESGVTLPAPGAAAARVAQEAELPAALRNHDRYEILELIGKGGMGDVYLAQHKLMNRQVALKVIKPHLVRNEAAVQRFRREVQAAARLHHKHIVTAYDAERAGDLHFLVMEFVPGVNLDEVIRRRGPLPVEEACDIVRQAAEGLQHAHELGMVHRDIKPHNLMVSGLRIGDCGLRIEEEQATADQSEIRNPKSAIVKILDFGLAGFATDVAEEELRDDRNQSEVETAAALHQLTLHGTMMGTPDYIAPEQAANAHAADIRADIYSLGCTLFTLLAGRAPFAEGTVLEKIKAHSEQEPPSILQFRDDVPAEVQAILHKMLAKDPADRYQTPADVALALARLIDERIDARLAERGLAGMPPKYPEGPSVSAGPLDRRPARWLAWLAAGALALVVLAVALGVVISVATDQGTLIIESDDPSVEITIAQPESDTDTRLEFRLVDRVTGSQVVRLPSGHYRLMLGKRGNEFTLTKDQFVLRRGDKVVARVIRQPDSAKAGSAKDAKMPSGFFESLGDLQAVVRKTLTDVGLTVGPMKPGTQVAGPRRLKIMDVDATGELENMNEPLTALQKKFKALASQADGFVSSLDLQMQGGVAATNLPYTTPTREGLIRVTMRKLRSDKREPKIVTWRFVIQVEEWPLAKDGVSPPAATARSRSDQPSQYFERLAGEPLESAVRERVGGAPGRRITAERIPQPPGRLRYEAQIDGVGSKIIDHVFVDLKDLVMRGTGARLVHEGERGIDLRLLRYTTPTHNGEVRVTLSSRELSGQPADESTKWLLKIEASEWAKGASQATPAVVRVEMSTDSMTLTLDGAPLTREVLLSRLDALATGDPGFQVHIEGDVVPVTRDIWDLIKDIGATAVGEKNVKFPSEVTQRIMDDAVQRGKRPDQFQELGQLEGHAEPATELAWHPDRKRAVSVSQNDGEVRMWDVSGRTTLWTAKVGTWATASRGHVAVAISADGTTVAVGDPLGTIHLLNADSGKPFQSWSAYANDADNGLKPGIAGLDFSPNGELLASVGHYPGTGKVWRLKTGEQVLPEADGANAHAVAFSPDGNALLMAVPDFTSYRVNFDAKGVPDVRSASATAGHELKALSVAASPRGDLFACGYPRGEIYLFKRNKEDSAHCQKLWVNGQFDPVGTINALAFTSDGRFLISSGDALIVWSYEVKENKSFTLKPIVKKEASGGFPQFALSPDGRTLLAIGVLGPIQILQLPESTWPPETLQPVAELQGHEMPINDVAFLPGGKRAVSVNMTGGQTLCWDLEQKKSLWTFEAEEGNLQCGAVEVSPSGKRVAVGIADGFICLLDAETGQEQVRWKAHDADPQYKHDDDVTWLAWSPNGELLASVPMGSGGVKLWNVKESVLTTPDSVPAEIITGEKPLRGETEGLSFSPASDYLFAGGNGYHMLKIAAWSTGKPLFHRFVTPIENDWVTASAASPDGRLVAFGRRGKATIFERGESHYTNQVAELEIPAGATARSIGFTADGRFLYTSAGDYNAAEKGVSSSFSLWEVASGFQRTLLHTSAEPIFAAAAVSPDGTQLLTGGGRDELDKQQKRYVSRGDCDLHLWRLPQSVWPEASPGPAQSSAAAQGTEPAGD